MNSCSSWGISSNSLAVIIRGDGDVRLWKETKIEQYQAFWAMIWSLRNQLLPNLTWNRHMAFKLSPRNSLSCVQQVIFSSSLTIHTMSSEKDWWILIMISSKDIICMITRLYKEKRNEKPKRTNFQIEGIVRLFWSITIVAAATKGWPNARPHLPINSIIGWAFCFYPKIFKILIIISPRK